MDQNKLKKLREVGYSIPKTCHLCVHRDDKFNSNPVTNWAVCLFHKYKHMKHTNSNRRLSIFRMGVCNNFELDELATNQLGAYLEFLE